MGGAWDRFWIKVNKSHFQSTSNKVIWPSKNQNPSRDYKVPFWQFFSKGRVGCTILVRPSRIPRRISKILFASGANDFLLMLEGKIREWYSFMLKYSKISVWFWINLPPVPTVPSPSLFAPPPKEYTEESLNSISHSASTTSTLLQCIPLLDYFCYYQGHKLRAAFCFFSWKMIWSDDGIFACQKIIEVNIG